MGERQSQETHRSLAIRCAMVLMGLAAIAPAQTQLSAQNQPSAGSKYQFKVGVLPFVDNTASGGPDLGAALSRAVQAEFAHSTDLQGRVVTLDPGTTATNVDSDKAVAMGRAQNVDVILIGTVLEATSERSSKSGIGPSFGGISLGGSANSVKATVTLQADIYDVTSGKKLDSIRATATDSETKVGSDISTTLGGLSTGGSSFDNAPIGKALHKAVTDLTKKVAAEERQMTAYAGGAAPAAATAAQPGGSPVATGTGTSGQPAAAAPGSASANDAPGKGVWLNYDFVPGERVLFYDDFSSDHVGDLPTHEDVSSGNVTVVDIKGQKYLHTVTGGHMTIALPEVLPQRFTVEFQFHRRGGNGSGLYMYIGPQGDAKSLVFRCDQQSATVSGTGPNGSKSSGQEAAGVGENDIETCRLMVDAGYAKAYVNAVRVGQINGLVFNRENKINIDLPNANEDGSLVTGIRVAAGGKKLFDGLSADGRVATQGILFDVNSDRLRGESTPTLNEIGDMLKEHADLNITIEGHTDNTGTAAGNQTLSDQRAAAVREYLINNYKIDAARLKSAGFGSSKPVASNDTPEGRQNNRRVELVKN